MKLKNSVSIVIPNFNGEKLLKANLPSIIRALKYKGNNIYEVIVVDDFSQDGSVELINGMFPDVKLIKHKVNRGYGVSVNTGARTAKGTLIALINSDVEVTQKFLEKTVDLFKNAKLFGVSLHEKSYGPAKGKFVNGFVVHEPLPLSQSQPVYTFWVNGGSGVIRREFWMKIGGMDDRLYHPFYWEDLDLSYRAQKRGYEVLWEPNSLVYHKHESTISSFYNKKFKDRIWERNQLLFIWKNIISPRLIRRHIAGIFQRLVKHPGYLIIILMALVKFREVRKARKKEKKESKVSDEAIFARF